MKPVLQVRGNDFFYLHRRDALEIAVHRITRSGRLQAQVSAARHAPMHTTSASRCAKLRQSMASFGQDHFFPFVRRALLKRLRRTSQLGIICAPSRSSSQYSPHQFVELHAGLPGSHRHEAVLVMPGVVLISMK